MLIILFGRLQRKREQRIKTAELAKESGVSGRVDVAEEEEQIALADCERLNKVNFIVFMFLLLPCLICG